MAYTDDMSWGGACCSVGWWKNVLLGSTGSDIRGCGVDSEGNIDMSNGGCSKKIKNEERRGGEEEEEEIEVGGDVWSS